MTTMMHRAGDPILIKSARDIEAMRAAGRILALVLNECIHACTPGVTTGELDDLAYQTFTRLGAEGLFFGYPEYRRGAGYPRHTCISINEEVVHGIPGDRIIRTGDIVSIDCGVRFSKWCADAARTVMVGEVSGEARRLVMAARRSLQVAIDSVRPGLRWSVVARKLQGIAAEEGLGIVRKFVGHGIGRSMHESPSVPNYVTGEGMADDFILRPGMVIAIEPMLTLGSPEILTLSDGWTVITQDKSLAAHEEHTVAITRQGADILTLAPAAEL